MNGVNGGMSFYISGTGSAIPRRRVTNDELATMVDTSDEWISTRTGIKERRVMTDETLLSLSAEAGRRALEDAALKPEDVQYYNAHGTSTPPSIRRLPSANACTSNPCPMRSMLLPFLKSPVALIVSKRRQALRFRASKRPSLHILETTVCKIALRLPSFSAFSSPNICF